MSHELGKPPTREQVAARLEVTPEEVAMVEAALSGRDVTLGPTDDGQVVDLPSGLASPEQEASENQVRERNARFVAEALEHLDERERIIVEKRLLSEDKVTLAEIGASMGLSRERVRQIELRARQKLREALLERVA
jgi:RNA polymerase sigma-32 factor